MSLTRDIARRAGGIGLADLPPAAQAAARVCLADALAVSLGALRLEPAAALFADHARDHGPGPATLLAGGSAGAAQAALANGALAHAVDFEDTFDPAAIHANAPVVPAVLALAEAGDATLGEALTALALGGDLGCRIALSLATDPAERNWYQPPVMAAVGAALAGAMIHRLDADRTASAMSLTFTQFALTDALKASGRSHLRAVRDGFAARAAVDSVLLAGRGVVATDDVLAERGGLIHMLTGAGPAGDHLAGFGRGFLGPEISIKLWPCCRGTHHGIAFALDLRAEGVAPDDIAAIAFTERPPCDMLYVPRDERVRPQTAINAKFSIPYCFASALVYGAPGLDSFGDAARADPATLALADRVTLRACDPGATPAAHVMLRSGARFDRELPPPPSVLAGDCGFGALAEKIAGCVAASGRGPAVRDVLMSLEEMPPDTPVRVLMACLSDGA
ncbi:hypothetical protein HKCCE2091_06620 [Rhodobacterales bacterium HKCCE2091]|nr:hypothetical protein [Rhodobacterales bacterium HKCCE2091]